MADDTSIKENDDSVLHMATDIVSAYVGNNSISTDDLPELIKEVFIALKTLGNSNLESETARNKPAVPIKKSIQPEFIICLEDGKKLKMLKRYLRTNFDMSPAEYRAKWGLPSDYPMVAPGYASRRSEFAKKIGLGKAGRKTKSKP